MKANELRVNNVAFYKGELIQIFGINTDIFEAINSKGETINDNNIWLTPIPLTEERLVKFGFKSHVGGFYNFIQIEMNGNANRYILVCDDMTVPCPFIDYVHQLQNLFFALTGNELPINK